MNGNSVCSGLVADKVNNESDSANDKRNSISFVDEKLIMNALNSTNGQKESKCDVVPQCKPFDRRRHNPTPGHQQHQKARFGEKYALGGGPKNGYFNNANTDGNNRKYGGQQLDNCKWNGQVNSQVPQKKAVIIYYNDPKTEIDVNEILNNYSEHAKVDQTSRKNVFYQTSTNQTNGKEHYNPRRGRNNQQKFKNGKSDGTVKDRTNLKEKKLIKQIEDNSDNVYPSMSEPITIYYTAEDASAVIEKNRNRIQSKSDQNCNGSNNMIDERPNESSQNGVIQKPEFITNGNGSDEYDVISGGAPVPNPILPKGGSKHSVMCTLVSHPGHFYIRFLNANYEEQLCNMTTFYNSDEHIELSIGVLKANQYFAASRLKPNTTDQEWIRVQLLQADSVDLLNCLLIDEGGFGTFKLSQLQPLYSQFRSVPKQAIRVSLAGVKPKEVDWLPKQALEFKTLVENRKLHTGSQAFDQTFLNKNNSIEIELYFDSDEMKDKSVSDVLIKQNIASKK